MGEGLEGKLTQHLIMLREGWAPYRTRRHACHGRIGGAGCKTAEPAAISGHAQISMILLRIFAPASVMTPQGSA
jgi:hypothetical protein